MTVEKNDVDITKLFVWGTEYEIVNGDDEVLAKVFMRILGDADVNKARVYALRKSFELRRKLKDSNSEERLIYIRDFDDVTDEELINYIVAYSMREIGNDSHKMVKVKRPTQPKADASLEKMEKFQKEVDDYPNKVKEAVSKYMKDAVDKLKKSLEGLTKEALYKKYEKLLVEEFCEQEALNSYNEMQLYLGCYKDAEYKERFFESFEQYENLDSQVKKDFRTAYDRLDVRMDELKKLREATL